MKTNTISIEADGVKIKGAPERMVQLLMAGFLTQAVPPAANVQPVAPNTVPALGEYWAGQGGYNGGLIAARGEVPAHYLIIAKNDVGDRKWSGRDKESAAFSKTDGMANTLALIAEGDHPAAKAATTHSADGHDDFYLPSCAELYHCWVNVPDLFAKDTWYWSSTQRSANNAFNMNFDDGNQLNDVKVSELRVRPVRRFFI